jgi:hypothetical protein
LPFCETNPTRAAAFAWLGTNWVLIDPYEFAFL